MPVSVICIEPEDDLCTGLQNRLGNFQFAVTRHARFLDCVPEIEKRAAKESVFLYVDPFTVEGLEYAAMDRVFGAIQSHRSSVEILLNFNGESFCRRGLAALKLRIPDVDPSVEDEEAIDATPTSPASIEKLDRVVGGDWWQELLRSDIDFAHKVSGVVDGLSSKLKDRFNEVCYHGVKALPHHTVPKYHLVFCTRHPDGLRLMNDQMVKSRETLADMDVPSEATLFEMRSEELVPDLSRIPAIVRSYTKQPTSRESVILAVIRDAFCEFSGPQIRDCIEQLLARRD